VVRRQSHPRFYPAYYPFFATLRKPCTLFHISYLI
jgi:hypothetical protein